MDAVEFGVRVRQRAVDLGLRQPELARLAGVSTSTIAKLQGSHAPMPTRPTAISIARALEWDIDEVLGWLGYAPLTEDGRAVALAPVPSTAERLKAMLRVWCRLSRSDQDVLMEVAALLESRVPARSSTGVTLFEASAGLKPAESQRAVRGNN